ncbi:ABC transporter ATP-binding protein [Streptomyces seoulensis]
MSQDVQGRGSTEEAAVSAHAAAPDRTRPDGPNAPNAPDAPDGSDRVAARARGLTKAYGAGETAVLALDSVDVDVARGRFTAVMGPSGSGKSTLMHCLAGLDTVSAGQVWIGGAEITGLKDRELTRLRRDRIGFMFQSFNLIPTLSALENITLPMDIAGRAPDREWLDQVVDTLGLGNRLGHRPAQLSGGQQQRVACARALAARPELIFADEPTGNLDSRAGTEVLGFLRDAVDRLGQTVVMVTHDPNAAARSDLVLFLADGRIVDEREHPTAEAVLARMRRFAQDGDQPGGPAPVGRPGILRRTSDDRFTQVCDAVAEEA